MLRRRGGLVASVAGRAVAVGAASHPVSLVDQTLGKVLDQFEIEHELFRRWGDAAP